MSMSMEDELITISHTKIQRARKAKQITTNLIDNFSVIEKRHILYYLGAEKIPGKNSGKEKTTNLVVQLIVCMNKIRTNQKKRLFGPMDLAVACENINIKSEKKRKLLDEKLIINPKDTNTNENENNNNEEEEKSTFDAESPLTPASSPKPANNNSNNGNNGNNNSNINDTPHTQREKFLFQEVQGIKQVLSKDEEHDKELANKLQSEFNIVYKKQQQLFQMVNDIKQEINEKLGQTVNNEELNALNALDSGLISDSLNKYQQLNKLLNENTNLEQFIINKIKSILDNGNINIYIETIVKDKINELQINGMVKNKLEAINDNINQKFENAIQTFKNGIQLEIETFKNGIQLEIEKQIEKTLQNGHKEEQNSINNNNNNFMKDLMQFTARKDEKEEKEKDNKKEEKKEEKKQEKTDGNDIFLDPELWKLSKSISDNEPEIIQTKISYKKWSDYDKNEIITRRTIFVSADQVLVRKEDTMKAKTMAMYNILECIELKMEEIELSEGKRQMKFIAPAKEKVITQIVCISEEVADRVVEKFAFIKRGGKELIKGKPVIIKEIHLDYYVQKWRNHDEKMRLKDERTKDYEIQQLKDRIDSMNRRIYSNNNINNGNMRHQNTAAGSHSISYNNNNRNGNGNGDYNGNGNYRGGFSNQNNNFNGYNDSGFNGGFNNGFNFRRNDYQRDNRKR